jgi:uncharacterized membrane protein
MSLLLFTSPVPPDAFDASWMHQPITYLSVAVVCLVIVLRFLKRALSPVGALVQALVAAAVVAFAAVLALAMLVVAAVTTVR